MRRVFATTGIHPLRAERDVDIASDLEATLLERSCQQRTCRPDKRGRHEHDRLSCPSVGDNCRTGGAQGRQIGSEMVVDRGRHANENRVGGLEHIRFVGEAEASLGERTVE
jgi:hypothetical protein